MSAIRSTTAVSTLLTTLLTAGLAGLALIHAGDAEAQRRGARPRQPAERPAEPPTPAGEAQPAAGPAAEPEPPPERGLYVGPSSCAQSVCHGSQAPRDVFAVLQNEYTTWRDDDPHGRAFEVLGNAQSAAIVANLRLAAPAYESRLCLDCHALTPPPDRQQRKIEVGDGISCEGCHGPASGWIEDHHTAEGWTRDDSLAAGLIDLSDPRRRAGVCLGCHAGDAERKVDHRLLAAGHPQLLFELDNFAAEMPPHWPPPRQYGDRADEVAAGRGAAAWAAGQAASFRAGLDQLAAQAGSGAWPEFTAMRCTDCHHSLAEERWRGEAAGRQPLGLPRWSPARWAVLRHLVDAFSPARRADLDRRVADLSERVARFAPAAEVAAEARAAAAALDGVGADLARVRWDVDRISAMLLRLAADDAAVRGGDRETAEQVASALNTLTSELLARRPGLATAEMIASLEAMYRTLEEPHAYDRSRFAGHLERFESQARAALRQGDSRR